MYLAFTHNLGAHDFYTASAYKRPSRILGIYGGMVVGSVGTPHAEPGGELEQDAAVTSRVDTAPANKPIIFARNTVYDPAPKLFYKPAIHASGLLLTLLLLYTYRS